MAAATFEAVSVLGTGNGKIDSAPNRSASDLLAEFKLTGRQEAFEEIVRRYAAMVFGVCLKTTRNAHDAEDATQAVFLTLAVQVKTDKAQISYLGPWLQKVARRTSLDIRRSKKRRETREEVHATNNGNGNGNGAYLENGSAALDVEELKAVLNEELNQLPAKYRLPMILHYYGGLTRDEIARELGCKAATLGVRIHRGRQMLAKRLTKRGAAPALMSLGLGAMLTLAVRSAVSDGMIASTSHAAANLMAGKQLGLMISSHVMAVAQGAVGTAMVAKLKTVAAVFFVSVLTLAAAGATAKVLPLEELKLQLPVRFDGLFRLPSIRSPFRPPQVNSNSNPARERAKDLVLVASRGTAVSAAMDALLWADERVERRRSRSSRNASASRSGSSGGFGSSGRVVAHLVSNVIRPNVSRPTPAPRPPAVSPAPQPPVVLATREPGRQPAVTPQAPTQTQSPRPRNEERRTPDALAFHPGGPGTRHVGQSPLIRSSGDVLFGPGVYRPLTPPARMPRAGATGSVTGTGGNDRYQTVVAPAPAGSGAPFGPQPQFRRPQSSMTIASARGSRGSVTLDGGIIDIETQVIGDEGHGIFTQNDGTNIASSVHIGAGAGGVGEYNLHTGELAIRANSAGIPLVDGIEVGGLGTGTFNFGTPDDTGSIGQFGDADGSLVVGGSPDGVGRFNGWGRVTLDGFFNQNGRVVADGFGADRTLEYSGFRYVGNSFDNPVGGTNGWFAQDRGKLVLPLTRVRQGTGTYTWGEDATDPTLDLVNSVRFSVHDAARDGLVRVSLLSLDHGDVPALPKGHTFIGVWQFEKGMLEHGDIDLLVRYDDGLAEALRLNENSLKLWRYHDGQWLRINDETFFRDTNLNLIGGTASDLEFFAVSAPEPSAISLALLAGAAALLRRPRRRGEH